MITPEFRNAYNKFHIYLWNFQKVTDGRIQAFNHEVGKCYISTENNLFCFLLHMQVEFVLGVALHKGFFSGSP